MDTKSLAFAKNEFNKISTSLKDLKADSTSIKNMRSIKIIDKFSSQNARKERKLLLISFMIIIPLSLYVYGFNTRQVFTKFWFWWQRKYSIENAFCTIEMPNYVQNALMPRFDCSVCEQQQNITKVSNISIEQFTKTYAYSGVPVVVTDAMTNWTATQVFSFNFFKEIYTKDQSQFNTYDKDCQFFPYKTEFKNLREVLNMDPKRANLEKGSKPWYVGWSNCDSSIGNILRQHYQTPYFLPEESEGTKMDWIFMGSPDYGAHMHIDHVGNPSWQSQVMGSKLWILEPPPECYTRCKVLEVVVEPQQIIVLNTNQWYHQTNIVGDSISITIGSEYD